MFGRRKCFVPERSLRFLAILLCLATLSAPQVNLAFVWDVDANGQVSRWVPSISGANTNSFNPRTGAIRFYLAADAYSSTNAAAELNSVRAAFGQWQSVPETSLKFEEAGLLSGNIDVNSTDGTNVVFWAKGNLRVNGGRDDLSNVLAVTFPRLSSENVLLEADVVLNGSEVAWFTDFRATPNSYQWIESTVLHEIGHVIGLKHSPLAGATMWSRSAAGINTQAGLSSDEMSAARALYPASGGASSGCFTGYITAGEVPIFGAVVVAEDEAGNVAAATISDAAGSYHLPGLAPGRYGIRATPLDPAGNPSLGRLIAGTDIASALASANTSFIATTNTPATVTRGATNRLDLRVIPRIPPFRITRIRPATSEAGPFSAINAATVVHPGDRDIIVGVYSPDLSPQGTLGVTGVGLTLSGQTFTENVFPDSKPKLNLLSARLTVATNASPGLRSFFVQQGSDIAFANGCLEILAPFPDYNFDGLDDRFQRRYFAQFTSMEAHPEMDADRDGLTNAQEYVGASDPTDAKSVLRIRRVSSSKDGTLVIWQSEPGKRYRLFRRSHSERGPWVSVGEAVTAADKTAELLDRSATNQIGFYRVQVLP